LYYTRHIQALCDTDELNNFKVFGRIQVVYLFIVYHTRNNVTVHKIAQRMKKTSLLLKDAKDYKELQKNLRYLETSQNVISLRKCSKQSRLIVRCDY